MPFVYKVKCINPLVLNIILFDSVQVKQDEYDLDLNKTMRFKFYKCHLVMSIRLSSLQYSFIIFVCVMSYFQFIRQHDIFISHV